MNRDDNHWSLTTLHFVDSHAIGQGKMMVFPFHLDLAVRVVKLHNDLTAGDIQDCSQVPIDYEFIINGFILALQNLISDPEWNPFDWKVNIKRSLEDFVKVFA